MMDHIAHRWGLRGLLLAMLVAPGVVAAQLPDFLKKLPELMQPAKPKETAGEQDFESAKPVKPRPTVAAELAPDIECKRPAEKFNLAEKLADYGGAAAELRLQRLVLTDFAHSDLTPEDKQMLAYLAQTTVWLPADAEAKLGSIYDTASSFPFFNKQTAVPEDLQPALAEVQKKLDALRQQVADYPADVRLTVDNSLPDGAFARFGGLIQVSARYLNTLEDSGLGADYLMAHELSHIYKRHAIKNIQFKLISSTEGWELARQVLKRAQRGMEIDPVADGVFFFRVLPPLIELVRTTQIKYLVAQELEADACAVVWLQRLKTDPTKAWRAYQDKLGVTSTSYGAEHPSSAEREARFTLRASGASSLTNSLGPDKGTVKDKGKQILKDANKK